MGQNEGLRIAVVGLGFGRIWVPAYRDHPDVKEVVICDVNKELLDHVGEEYGIECHRS